MDKLSRKGFFGTVAGLFAAPAVAMAMPEEPTGGYLIPPGNEDFIESIRNFRNFEGMAPSMDDFSHWVIYKRGDNGSPWVVIDYFCTKRYYVVLVWKGNETKFQYKSEAYDYGGNRMEDVEKVKIVVRGLKITK